MNKKIHYAELGATLFVPATHKNLAQIVSGTKYPNLKSVVIDTEDAISDGDIENAIKITIELLSTFKKSKLLVFVRPRNVDVLGEILISKDINKLDGFILPKFSLINAQQYLDILEPFSHQIMPSIEGNELFDTNKLTQLKKMLVKYKEKVILVRFGLEDMLRQLSMRRTCEDSILILL